MNNLSDKEYTLEVDLLISDEAVVIFNWIFYTVLCLMLSIFGMVTNIINIICFVKQGFKDSINVSLLGLALADLGSLATFFWVCIILTPAFMDADFPFYQLDVAYQTSGMPHFAFTRVSSCITAIISLERCLCVTTPLKIKSIITPDRAAVINFCTFVLMFLSSTPSYIIKKFDTKFFPNRNKTLIGLVLVEGQESVEKLILIINNFTIPFCAFLIISASTILISFKLKFAAKWRGNFKKSDKTDKVSLRNQKVSKMVVSISFLFIVCFVPNCIIMVVYAYVPELRINGPYINISFFMFGGTYVLEGINSSMNIFIYYRMGSKFRDTFNSLFNKIEDKPMRNISRHRSSLG